MKVKNESWKLINSIIAPSDTTVKLCEVSKLESFEKYKKIHDMLQEMYKTEQHRYCMIATFFNSVFTQKTKSFVLTRKIMIGLMKKDQNHDFSLGGNQYQAFLDDMINQSKVLRVIEKPTKSSAGFFHLNEENQSYGLLKEIVSEEILQDKHERSYDYFKKSFTPKYKPVMTPEEKQALLRGNA